MNRWLAGLLLFTVITGASFMGGCTTAQVQTNSDLLTGLTVSAGMLDGVYASMAVYCNTGQLPAGTCSNLTNYYNAAQSAIAAVKAVSSLDNSTSIAGAATQATAAILAAYFEIAAAISSAKGGK